MTWSYLPLTKEDRQAMFEALGIEKGMDLFDDIPANLVLQRTLDLGAGMGERELAKYFAQAAKENCNVNDYPCFLGAGAYDHFIPATVGAVLSRGEFLTAYTQYQPEIAQGYLQALWEYQSMICEITGMAVCNASMYDGATAAAEAAVLACSSTRRNKIVVATALHPNYRKVITTYAQDFDYEVVEVGMEDGVTQVATVEKLLDKDIACLIVQNPNFFGSWEDLQGLINVAHGVGALAVVVADPIALALTEAPGKLGADLVVGDGQAMGLPLAFGGPYVGFMTANSKLMRKLPGRIVGETVDVDGKRGFVLTLQAREQHIRREKATSNICSNEALCALGVAVYMTTLGKKGYVEVAKQSLQKAHYAAQALEAHGVKVAFTSPFFQEFVVKLPVSVEVANAKLLAAGMLGGLDLGAYYPELTNHMLLCVTENRTKAEIDALVAELGAL